MPPDDVPSIEDAYDKLAQSYTIREDDPYCADLEFPSMKALMPTIAGKRILDAGCGCGRYTEWLIERGARVVAVDQSDEMLEQAKARVNGEADFRRADLGKPLTFVDDNEFEGIVCGLSLHYVEDWRVPLTTFSRILEPGGFLAISTHHPLDDFIACDAENYFEIERASMTWSTSDEEVTIPFYRRPFAEIVNPLIETGFQLEELVEPKPKATFKQKKPESYEKRLGYPTFLCIRASKSGEYSEG